MDTKTDTKLSLRICGADHTFSVHLGVHFSLETGSATLYHRACPASFGADNVGHAGVYQLTEPRGGRYHFASPEPPKRETVESQYPRPNSARLLNAGWSLKVGKQAVLGCKLNPRVGAEPLVFEYQFFHRAAPSFGSKVAGVGGRYVTE